MCGQYYYYFCQEWFIACNILYKWNSEKQKERVDNKQNYNLMQQ